MVIHVKITVLAHSYMRMIMVSLVTVFSLCFKEKEYKEGTCGAEFVATFFLVIILGDSWRGKSL